MSQRPTPSRAATKGHPVHPMLIPLPIGLLMGTLGADIGYVVDDMRAWALAAAWLVGAPSSRDLLSVAAGFIDFIGVR